MEGLSGETLRKIDLSFEYEFNRARCIVWKYFKYAHSENLAMMPEQVKAHELSVLLSSPSCKVKPF